jgi:hypothetical protein
MARYRLREKVLLQKVSDEMVILDLLDGQYHGLDPVGTRMLALVEEHGESEELVRCLQAEFDADDDRLRSDFAMLMAKLEDKGLVELVDQ